MIGVVKGDTINMLRDKEQVRIRLYGFDTLERGQAFGKKAKQFTSKMVFGKKVRLIIWIRTDAAGSQLL